MRIRHLLVALVLTTATLAWAPTPSATAATNCNDGDNVRGDIDGDGFADTVVGLPSFNGSRGVVELQFATGDAVRLTISDVNDGLTALAGQRFGDAVAIADLDGDGCDELLIGAPGLNSGAGAVLIAWMDGDAVIGQMTFFGAQVGGRYGSALAVSGPANGPTNTTPTHVYVGAPSYEVDGKDDAGALAVLRVKKGDAPASFGLITQDSAGIPGSASENAAFGVSLATEGKTVIVGAPGATVAGKVDAGAIVALKQSAGPADNAPKFSGKLATQNSANVPDKAETDDLFGLNVAYSDGWVAAGVQDESLGALNDAGGVQLFRWNESTKSLSPSKLVTMNSPGVPLAAEDGAEFGARVAWGKGLLGAGQPTLVVSAPNYSQPTANTGLVYFLQVSNTGSVTAAKALRHGAGVPGPSVAEQFFGVSLHVVNGTQVTIGETGHESTVGRVWVTGPKATHWRVLTNTLGPVPSTFYGQVVG